MCRVITAPDELIRGVRLGVFDNAVDDVVLRTESFGRLRTRVGRARHERFAALRARQVSETNERDDREERDEG